MRRFPRKNTERADSQLGRPISSSSGSEHVKVGVTAGRAQRDKGVVGPAGLVSGSAHAAGSAEGAAGAPGETKPLVIYWNNQPTPYFVARINAVAAAGNVRIEAWFDEMRLSDRSWTVDPAQWNFDWHLVPQLRTGRRTTYFPALMLMNRRPDVFIANYDQLDNVIGTVLARSLCNRLAVRALPAYDAQMKPNRWRGVAWKIVFKIVDGAKVPGPDGTAFARRFGLPGDRTWSVTQSIDVALYASARDVPPGTIADIRADWGDADFFFIAVGRIIESKGIRCLLDAWESVRTRLPNAALVIAGDGDAENEFKALSKDWPEVRWLGFRQPAELPVLYAAADVFVFPTLGDPNGLVVEEARAAGLPIISTDAAGDISSRVRAGKNGWIVPAGDVRELASALLAAGADGGRASRELPKDTVDDIAAYRPELYAADFERFCRDLLTRAPRHTWQAEIARVLSWLAARLFRHSAWARGQTIGRDRKSEFLA